MEHIHQIFLETLLRFPKDEELDALANIQNIQSVLPTLRQQLVQSVEGQLCILIKDYQGIDINLTDFRLGGDIELYREFMIYLHDIYSKYMFKSPLREDYNYALMLFKTFGLEKAKALVLARVLDQNECKYLKECLDVFFKWPIPNCCDEQLHVNSNNERVINVRYYGPVGTSGYSTACRDIVWSMYKVICGNSGTHSHIKFSFIPCSIQNFNPDDTNKQNRTVRRACPINSTEDFYKPLPPVDIVFVHSVPDMWVPICRRERLNSPNVIICGVTVWETDSIPPQWKSHLRWVDCVTMPNEWNCDVMTRDVPGLNVKYIPHPVIVSECSNDRFKLLTPPTGTPLQQMRQSLQQLVGTGRYVFYSINEWSGRKAIDALLRCYIQEFNSTDNVVLFIKTHSRNKDVCSKYVSSLQESKVNPPIIITDYDRWANGEIELLHTLGHCYISLTKAEGQGLGLCHAALKGKRVIVTMGGGQATYLKHVDVVNATKSPAYQCSPSDSKHIKCLRLPCCRDFGCFIAAQQNWFSVDEKHAKELMRNAYRNTLLGNTETTKYIKDNFNYWSIGSKFIEFAKSLLQQHVVKVPFPRKGLPNTYSVSAELLLPLYHFVPSQTYYDNKPTVLFLGAYFYGNTGDNSYVIMHQRAFNSELYNIAFCNTTTFINKHGFVRPLSEYVSDDDVKPFDYLVVGGGGLINSGELRSSIFRVYLPYCKKYNKPYSFISVGFGYPCVENESMRELQREAKNMWSEALSGAESISVRSYADQEYLKTLVPLEKHHTLRVYPDAVYGLPTVLSVTPSENRYIVYVPSNFLNTELQDVVVHIQRQLCKYKDSRLVLVSMDGIVNNQYPTPFIQSEIGRVKKLFPDVIVYAGDWLSGPMKDIYDDKYGVKEISPQTPVHVLNVFNKAHYVIAGRYHAVVLAKALHKPYYVGTCNLHKITSEIRESQDFSRWIEHYKYLQFVIKSCIEKGPIEHPLSMNTDDRNTFICDISTNSDMGIPCVQCLSNEQLVTNRRKIFIGLPTDYI